MWFALPLFFLGGLAGLVVCRLPGWLFFRHEKSLTAEELRDRYPQRAWILSVWRGVLILAFVLFAPLFFTTDTKKALNVFFIPLVYITWMYALVGVLEVIKKTEQDVIPKVEDGTDRRELEELCRQIREAMSQGDKEKMEQLSNALNDRLLNFAYLL